MSVDGEPSKGEAMSKRAIEQIMKLVSSQLSLERNQRRLEKKDPNAGTRMHEIDDTLEKLVKVAKKKGYLDPEATVESLKEEARARAATERAAKSEREESSTGQMEAMRKRLDTQTAAVTQFLKEREDNDGEWEADGWAKLLNANQDVLVLMQRLYEKDLINENMIQLATLPPHPPPRQSFAPQQQQQQQQRQQLQQHGAMYDHSGSIADSTSLAQMQYVPQSPSMMGMPGMQQGMMNSQGMMNGGMHPGMSQGMMSPHMMQQPGMMPQQVQYPGMMQYPGMQQGGYPGMHHGMMSQHGMMNGGMMPGMGGMMSPGMMNQGMGQMGMGSQMGSMGHGGQGSYMQGAEVSVMGSNASKMNGNGKQKQIYDFEDDHCSGYSAGEEETNEELRRLRGMEKLSAKEKKKTKEEAKEEAMFKKNKGIGNFNNGFKVADDIRTLGAVPEDDSGDEREVVLDKHMALAMEERLLRGVEEELFREKKAMVKSFLKGDSVMGGGGGSMMGGEPQGSSMQMSMMQQNMMQMQMMMQQMWSLNNARSGMSGMGGPGMLSGMAGMGGMPSGMGGMPSGMGGMPSGMNPAMMQGMHPGMSSGMSGGMQPGMQPVQGMGSMMPMGSLNGSMMGPGNGQHPGMSGTLQSQGSVHGSVQSRGGNGYNGM